MKNHYTRMGVLCLSLMLVFSSFSLFANSKNELAFQLTCPEDVTVNCDAYLGDLSIFGQAYYKDHNGWQSAGTPVVCYNLGMCNTGTITRTWSVEDPNWNWESCTQTIYVQGSNGGFNENNIHWPEDVQLTGCNPNTHPSALPSDAQYPTYDYVECSMIGISHTDYLYTVNASCKKIMRVWKVLDWCQEGYDSYGNQTGIWQHTQIIKIINNEVPTVTCTEDVHASSTNCSTADVNVPSLHVDPTSCGGDYTITNDSPYATHGGANISGTYPIGTTIVNYTIKYGCGGFTTCSVKVIVENDSKPTPYCVGSLYIALMGIDSDNDGVNDQGMVEIWAKDFDRGSFSACHNSPVTMSFSPDSIVMTRTFTCDHVGENWVKVWAIDATGQKDFCEVRLVVQNNGANIENCEPKDPTDDDDTGGDHTDTSDKHTLAGRVKTSTYAPVSGVDLTAFSGLSDTTYTYTHDTTITYALDTIQVDTGQVVVVNIDTLVDTSIDTLISEEKWTTISGDLGNYRFDSIAVDSSVYTVIATMNDSIRNLADNNLLKTINSGDLQLIMDVILEKDSFATRQQHIAADINRDGVVDFEDLMIMYKYLTGEIDQLTDNNWILVADTYLTTEAQPTQGYNRVAVPIYSSDELNIGFTLVQIGKVTQIGSNIQGYRVELEEVAEEKSIKLRSQDDIPLHIKAYPNPFHDRVTLAYDGSTKGDAIRLQMIDMSGRILHSSMHIAEGSSGTITIHNTMPYKGILIYRMVHNEKTTIGKLIKE